MIFFSDFAGQTFLVLSLQYMIANLLTVGQLHQQAVQVDG